MVVAVLSPAFSSAKIHNDFTLPKSPISRPGCHKGRPFRGIAGWHFRGKVLARKCHLQNLALRLTSQVSSSGGGLPGRPGLERVSGRSLFWGKKLLPWLGNPFPPDFNSPQLSARQ